MRRGYVVLLWYFGGGNPCAQAILNIEYLGFAIELHQA